MVMLDFETSTLLLFREERSRLDTRKNIVSLKQLEIFMLIVTSDVSNTHNHN